MADMKQDEAADRLERRQTKINWYLFYTLAGGSAVIAILDFFNVLQGISFLNARLPALSLLLISTLFGYLGYQIIKLEKIHTHLRGGFENTNQLITEQFAQQKQLLAAEVDKAIFSLKGGPITILDTAEEAFNYAVNRMAKAKKGIDDLTWGRETELESTQSQQQAFIKYVQAIPENARRPNLTYREVMTFHDSARVKRAADILNQNIHGYLLRYYDTPQTRTPPLLSFMIFDSEEVILTTIGNDDRSPENETHLVIKHPEIVQFFQNYYNLIWRQAKKLKDAGDAGNVTGVLQRIEQHLPKTQK